MEISGFLCYHKRSNALSVSRVFLGIRDWVYGVTGKCKVNAENLGSVLEDRDGSDKRQ